MLDPFPLAPPASLARLVSPLAHAAHLTSLPAHAHEVVLFAAAYAATQSIVAPRVSAALFPRTYAGLTARTRLNWDVHVVSLVQAVVVCAAALWVMCVDEERAAMGWEERVWGYTGGLGLIQALGCGYFLWDLWVSLVYVDMFGWGMLAHAVSALAVFVLGFVSCWMLSLAVPCVEEHIRANHCSHRRDHLLTSTRRPSSSTNSPHPSSIYTGS